LGSIEGPTHHPVEDSTDLFESSTPGFLPIKAAFYTPEMYVPISPKAKQRRDSYYRQIPLASNIYEKRTMEEKRK
jgi:hypothetical protein